MSQLTLLPMPEKPRVMHLTSSIPRWLSPVVAAEVAAHVEAGGQAVCFRFSSGEKKILRRRKVIAPSVWAERHRIVEDSSIPGRWKNLFTQYLVGIMDAAGTPGVEVIIICKTAQSGGSEAVHNVVGWSIDHAPGPVMYVFPDEAAARENATDRIIPMITSSARLREYMTGYENDASSLRIKLAHMMIYLAWSGSASRLGNKPIRTLVMDELDSENDSLTFSEENILNLLDGLFASRGDIMRRCIDEAFDMLTKYHKENRMKVEGWKTNDAWRVNRRAVLPYCVNAEWGNPRINYGRHAHELNDLDRAMAFLEGKSLEQITTVFDVFNRMGQQFGKDALGTLYESTYFEFRGYKKGTLHLHFKDKSLWERFNIEAARGKNWLPDDYKAREKEDRARNKFADQNGLPMAS